MRGRQATRAGLVALAFGSSVAGAAASCVPETYPAGGTEDYGYCAKVTFPDASTRNEMGEAGDLGGGFVSQHYREGTLCAYTVSMIVVECAAGRAVIFGPGATEGGDHGLEEVTAPFNALKMAVERAAAEAAPMSLESIRAAAEGRFANAVIVPTGAPVGLSNTSAAPRSAFDLGCGCALHYPGTAQAGS